MDRRDTSEPGSWQIEDGPEDIEGHGHDATLWRWRLRQPRTGLTAQVVVKVSGTAMATDPAELPAATRDVRYTAGKSEVMKILDWWEPPRVIELHTVSEDAYRGGGSPHRPVGDVPDEERRIAEIEGILKARGIVMRLQADEEHDRWIAMIIPEVLRVGATDLVLGKTRLEAAESALVLLESYPAPVLGGNTLSLPPVTSAGEGRAHGEPLAQVEAERRELEGVAADFGWRIAFAPEPDGSWFWLVIDAETDEVINSGVSESWDDARLAAIENLMPPSHEK
jgi:hypothetical protein